LGKHAMEEVLKKVHHPQIVLLSTHGFFIHLDEVDPDPLHGADPSLITEMGGMPKLPDTPLWLPVNPLLRCGIMLAGANRHDRTEGDDGILTGMEILGLDLRGTELVVLSACETGVGEVRGGQGVGGLLQAFQLAGAESVVSTLWPVLVTQSVDLVDEFFTHLSQGESKAAALRSAQLAAIRRAREQTGEQNAMLHPFIWGAYTITGR